MKTPTTTTSRIIKLILCVVIILSAGIDVHAATFVIQFGGSLGETYSPNTLNVLVGDTIQWVGDFSMHPLSSTSVPTGASTFHQGSGSTFSYIATVAGTYHYQCDYHYSLGMIGSFIVTTPTGVVKNQTSVDPNAFRLNQNYPNPFNPTTIISFNLPVRAHVSLKVYDLIGHEVATIVNEPMAAGSHSAAWNAASLQSGIYFYMLNAGSYTETKKLVLLK